MLAHADVKERHMKKISTIEKFALVKDTMHDLGININEMTVAEACNIFRIIEKKITWYQYMSVCRTLAEHAKKV
jgi:hypothetical protein